MRIPQSLPPLLTPPQHTRTNCTHRLEQYKWKAVVTEIARIHKEGRPVLVGTTSVEKSELISSMLTEQGIKHRVGLLGLGDDPECEGGEGVKTEGGHLRHADGAGHQALGGCYILTLALTRVYHIGRGVSNSCVNRESSRLACRSERWAVYKCPLTNTHITQSQVLNAKPENVERESEIVAQSGRRGAVTISTNMAGRGTDILLGGEQGVPVCNNAPLFLRFGGWAGRRRLLTPTGGSSPTR